MLQLNPNLDLFGPPLQLLLLGARLEQLFPMQSGMHLSPLPPNLIPAKVCWRLEWLSFSIRTFEEFSPSFFFRQTLMSFCLASSKSINQVPACVNVSCVGVKWNSITDRTSAIPPFDITFKKPCRTLPFSFLTLYVCL